MSNKNLKGFAEYYMTIDPEGLYTVKQVNTAKGYYSAGFDACNGKKVGDASYKPRIDEVIAYFNEVAGKKVGATPSHVKAIKGRLIEKYTVDQLKAIVDYVVLDWTGKMFGNTPAETYIRIPTLFGSSEKVDKYLGLAEQIKAEQENREARSSQVLTTKPRSRTKPRIT